MTRRYTYHIAVVLSILVSCRKQEAPLLPDSGPEITGVEAVITNASTKASPNADYVGRNKFAPGDVMVLTKVERTANPLAAFSYRNARFICGAEQAWDRDYSDGYEQKDRIFWSDNKSGHTFVGFCTPQDWEASRWTESASVFSGFIDNVDFSDIPGDGLKSEDILLAYDTDMHPDASGLTTTVPFRHALASLRVIINIQGFSPSSSSEDVKTNVTDMVVLNQPWKYSWDQSSWAVTDATADADGTKDFKAWQPNPAGEGIGEAKKFTFYSLIVPGNQSGLELEYQVSYPKYLNPAETETKTYRTRLVDADGNDAEIIFRAGYTTTINVSLNHDGEPIYLGAEYIDWENVETPDRSELQKVSTFLDVNDRVVAGKTLVSIAKDQVATRDDATWLYYENGNRTDESSIVDLYGNNGSAARPFEIKTARQFLSFAYEVKDGRSFENQYILLECDLYLQKDMNTSDIIWPGIGAPDKPFAGTLLGGGRIIKAMKGKPLFYSTTATAHICNINLQDAVSCAGDAVFVENNAGLICGSMVGTRRNNPNVPGPVELTTTGTVCGAFCAVNSGVLNCCYSTASLKVKGTATVVGGLVGSNSGTINAAYSAGTIENLGSVTAVGGVVGSGTAGNNCLFDADVNTDAASSEQGKTTKYMQSPQSVEYLNAGIAAISDPHAATFSYEYHISDYPWL